MLSSGSLSDDVWKAADRVASYLSVLLAVEYDIDTVDRIAKARKLDDFMEGIYNALRRRHNLEDKLENALREHEKRKEGEKGKEINEKRLKALNDALNDIRSLNPIHLERLRSLDRGNLKLVASYIGSRALAYTEKVGTLMQIFQGEG